MKNLTLIIVILIFEFYTCLQAQQNIFSKVLSESTEGNIQAYSIVSTLDSGYLIAGRYSNNYRLDNRGLVIKVDLDGNVLWNKVYSYIASSESYFAFADIIRTNDSCFVLTGQYRNSFEDKFSAVFMKINSEGNNLWSRRITISNEFIYPISIIQTSDSGYLMTGYTLYYAEGGYERDKAIISKLDNEGNLQWIKTLTKSGSIGYSVNQTDNNHYIIAGLDGKAFLIQLSQDGTPLLTKYYYPNEEYYIIKGIDIQITSSGFLLFLDMSDYITLLKTDISGNIIWSKSYDNPYWYEHHEYIPKLHITSDNGYLLIYHNHDWFNYGGCVLKLDSIGDPMWIKILKFFAIDVIESNNKNYFFVGNGPLILNVVKSSSWSETIGLIQTDSLGNGINCVDTNLTYPRDISFAIDTFTLSYSTNASFGTIPISINSIEVINEDGCVEYFEQGGAVYELSIKDVLIFPNPSIGIFTISFNHDYQSQISIFNSLGRSIHHQAINQKQLNIDLSNEPSGIYFYEIILSNNKITTGKLVISK